MIPLLSKSQAQAVGFPVDLSVNLTESGDLPDVVFALNCKITGFTVI